MKKLFALMLAIVMVFVCCVAVFAEENKDSITITLKDPPEGGDAQAETLTGYKILDVKKTANADASNNNTDNMGFAYSIASDSPWLTAVKNLKNDDGIAYFEVTQTADGTSYSVTLNPTISLSEEAAKDMAAKLLAAKPDDAVPISVTTGTATEAVPGYYLFVSPLGENLVLATTNIEIAEKNEYPTVSKEDDKDDDTASIGDDVVYTIEITIPEKANNILTVNDTMTEGLTFKGDSLNSVKIKEGEAITTGYSFTKTNAQKFSVEFTADCVKANQGKTIVIEYTATVNDKAVVGVVDDANGNRNDVEITYSNYSMTDFEPLETYKYEVVKVDGEDSILTGAEFTLWDEVTDGNKINVVATETTGVYRIAAAGEEPIDGNMVTDNEGKLTIIGLGNGDYYLQEDVAPDGYNKLAARKDINISSADKTATVESNKWTEGDKIINQSGTELPSTGGSGTTLFYVIGGLLIIGAAVVLVARRKAQE